MEAGPQIPPQPGDAEDEQRAQGIRADDGQHIALGPHVEAGEEQDGEAQVGGAAQNAVHRHQPVQLAAAHELGAPGAQAAHQHMHIKERRVLREQRDEPQQRIAAQHDDKAGEDGEQAVGEHRALLHLFVQAEADDGVAHAHAHQRDEQRADVLHQLGDAHLFHLAHGEGDVGLQHDAEQLCRKVADGEQKGVVRQAFVLCVQRDLPFRGWCAQRAFRKRARRAL